MGRYTAGAHVRLTAATASRPTIRQWRESGTRPPSCGGADGGPVRVLVVDDEVSLSELLSMALHYEGGDVQTAADGATAVRAAREHRPDAVVLDVMLPDLDGLEVLRRLRAEAAATPSSAGASSCQPTPRTRSCASRRRPSG